MSTLQNQVVQSIEGLSDDSLEFILDMIQRFVKPAENQLMETTAQRKKRKLGILKGKNLLQMDMIWMSVIMKLLKCLEWINESLD